MRGGKLRPVILAAGRVFNISHMGAHDQVLEPVALINNVEEIDMKQKEKEKNK